MPSSEIIPRERLSAWERWELSSLGATPSKAESEKAAADALAAERTRVVLEARAAGYAQGRAEAAAEQARLTALIRALDHCVVEHEQQLVDEVLDLAIELARQMVGEALVVRREAIQPLVSAALRQLPQNTQHVLVKLNPVDVPIVHDYIAGDALGERVQLLGDPAIAAGGCRVDTDQCDIDATLDARWKRLLVSLGRNGEWLERS